MNSVNLTQPLSTPGGTPGGEGNRGAPTASRDSEPRLREAAGEGSRRSRERSGGLNGVERQAPGKRSDGEKPAGPGQNLPGFEDAKDQVNKALEQLNVKLSFNLNRDLDRMIVKVVNRESGEVVRQIPPEEMLEIAKRMEEMGGILLDERR